MLEDNSLMKVESGISMNDYEERQKTIEQILSNKDSEKSTSNRPRLLSLTFYEGDSVNVEQETQRTTGWVRDTQWAIMPGWSAVGQTGIYAYPPPWEEVNIIQTPIILAPEDHRLGYSGSTGASRTVYYIDIFTEQKWSRFGNTWWDLPDIGYYAYYSGGVGYYGERTYPHTQIIEAKSSHIAWDRYNSGLVAVLATGPIQNQSW